MQIVGRGQACFNFFGDEVKYISSGLGLGPLGGQGGFYSSKQFGCLTHILLLIFKVTICELKATLS